MLITLVQIYLIIIEFNEDKTFSIRQWYTSGTLSLMISGLYSQSASVVVNFWTIRLDQLQPYTIVGEGIFEISSEILKLEVIQTILDIRFIPPTPQGGFGSSNGGGIYGTANGQTFIKGN